MVYCSQVVVSCLLAVAYAKPGFIASPAVAYSAAVPGAFGYSYSSHLTAPVVAHSAVVAPVARAAVIAPLAHSAVVAPYAHTAVVAPVVSTVEKTQYHAQDALGQAAYGHAEAFQAHNAVQDAAGNKVGSYSYVAPDGQVIATNYVADALGYRVASNAVPVGPSAPAETPEVVAARAAHLQEVENVKHRSRRSPVVAALPVAYTHPLAYTATHPVAYTTPVLARTGLTHVVAAPHAYAYRYY